MAFREAERTGIRAVGGERQGDIDELAAMSAAPRRCRVALLWHSASSGNLGVGALTVANIALVRSVAEELGIDVELTIMGMADGDMPSLVDDRVAVRAIDFRRLLSPLGLFAWLRRCDLVLDIGAGDSFASIYSAKRFAMLFYSKVAAWAARVPLVLSPQTIGPFARAPYPALAGWILSRAAAVVARDTRSAEVARDLAPGARVVLAADVAFLLPHESRAAERGGATGGRLRVGVNISGLLLHAARTGRNPYGLEISYPDFVGRLLDSLSIRADVELHLVTHAISGGDASDDDASAADEMAARYPGAIRVPEFTHPSEAKAYISSLDFLIASRMHACIAAFSAGVPVVPVAYSRKFKGVFGLLGYDVEVPVRGMGTEEAVAYTLGALDRRGELSRSIADGMTRVTALLDGYRAVLREMLDRTARPAGTSYKGPHR